MPNRHGIPTAAERHADLNERQDWDRVLARHMPLVVIVAISVTAVTVVGMVFCVACLTSAWYR